MYKCDESLANKPDKPDCLSSLPNIFGNFQRKNCMRNKKVNHKIFQSKL